MIAVEASITQQILNIIMVGRVLMVEVLISSRLDTTAKIYSHHHCFPRSRPGTMIMILVVKAKNSMVFTLFQYSRDFIVLIDKINSGVLILQPS
jgi:hypothetical protein